MRAKRYGDRITRALEAWTEMRPNKSFAGMTLEEFKKRIKPSLEARTAIADAQIALKAARADRANADLVSNALVKRVVAAVVADAEEGDNGAFYSRLGYVRQADRASGLVRKRRKGSSNTNSSATPITNAPGNATP